jgi:hypothetical protein
LAGGAGLIAKTYAVLHILHKGDTITLIPILVGNEQQALQVQHSAKELDDVYDSPWSTDGTWYYITKVDDWNQSELRANIVRLRNESDEYQVRETLAFSDAWVTRLIDLGTRQEAECQSGRENSDS